MLKYLSILLLVIAGKTFAQNPSIDTACQHFTNISPVITIANDDPLICEGELTLFTSQASYGNAVPSYHWLVNGDTVGDDNPDYSTTSLTNGARVECVLTISTPSCPGQSKSSKSEITIYVYPLIHPAITITPSKTRICRGEEVTFTATANGGPAPTFTWEINHKQIGQKAPSLSTSTLREGDTVSCTITVDQDSRCHTSTSAPSNEVIMHVYDYIDPTVKIASPKLEICSGMALAFAATSQNAGVYRRYQWLVNGSRAGNDTSIFIYNQFANRDKVSCILSTNIPDCPITVDVYSDTEMVTVISAPVITFLPPAVSILSGEAAQLNASVSGNTASIQWTPAAALLTPQALISSTVPLLHDTSFNLSVTDANGCVASKDLLVTVLHKMYIPSAFTPNQDGKNDVFRIPPGSSFSLHDFSVFDRWGNIVFTTPDVTKGWDGTYKGQTLGTGTFIYLIKGTIEDKEMTVKGTVLLVR